MVLTEVSPRTNAFSKGAKTSGTWLRMLTHFPVKAEPTLGFKEAQTPRSPRPDNRLRWCARVCTKANGWSCINTLPPRSGPKTDQYTYPAFPVRHSPRLHNAAQKKDNLWIRTLFWVHFRTSNTKYCRSFTWGCIDWMSMWTSLYNWVLFFVCGPIWPSMHRLQHLQSHVSWLLLWQHLIL